MRLTKKRSLFLLLFLFQHTQLAATELTGTYIEQFAKDYLVDKFPSTEDEKVRISVSKLDPRITIKSCSLPLTASVPEKKNTRNVSIKITCDEPTPWKIYLSAKIEITKAVLIAKSTISKGDKLDVHNVELAYIPTNKIRGKKLTDTTVVFGAKAKRRIAAGKAINKNSICLICKGDVVTIIASSDSFNIKTQGVALSSGNINEQIRVKNTRSNKVITPRVKGVNQVVIHL